MHKHKHKKKLCCDTLKLKTEEVARLGDARARKIAGAGPKPEEEVGSEYAP